MSKKGVLNKADINNISDLIRKEINKYGVEAPSSLSDSELRKVLDIVKETNTSTTDQMSEYYRLPSTVIQNTDPNDVILPTINETSINTSTQLFTIKGDKIRGSKLTADEEIAARVSDTGQRMSFGANGAIYRFMVQSRQHLLMEEQMPVLKTASKLMVDDICSGSMRADDGDMRYRFRFYKNGTEIKDSVLIKNAEEILNPKGVDSILKSDRSFYGIDVELEHISRRDGMVLVEPITHSSVAKDLHIKYLLSETKKDTMKNPESGFGKPTKTATVDVKITNESVFNYPSSDKALSDILFQFGIESSDYNSVLSLEENNIDPSLVHDDYIIEQRRYYNKGKEISKIDYDRLNTYESFEDFCTNYLVGQRSPVYMTESSDGIPINFSIENGVPTDVGYEILSSLFGTTNRINQIGIESAYDFIDKKSKLILSDNEKELLANMSFDDIMNISPTSFLRRNGRVDAMGLESNSLAPTDIDIVSAYTSNPIESLYQKIYRAEYLEGDLSDISLESFNDPNYYLDKYKEYEIAVENAINEIDNGNRMFEESIVSVIREKHLSNEDNNLTDKEIFDIYSTFGLEIQRDIVQASLQRPQTNTPGGKRDFNDLENMLNIKRKYNSRLDRLYGSIKGETSRILENARTIPIMVNDKLLGAFFMEYTAADVQYLMNVRSILGNPVAFQTNMDMMGVDNNQQEERMGRVLFSDTIKPLIEDNIDIKFIKNNVEMLYSIQKLMEENEISFRTTTTDPSRYSLFNMTKLKFIPASSLIMRRNGDSKFGESLYENILTPANMYILARESWFSWVCVDGKGASILVIPKGLSDQPNEAGTGSLIEQVRLMDQSRLDLRTMGGLNFNLNRRLLTMVAEEGTPPLAIHDIEYPEFSIDDAKMNLLLQEATDGVGYAAASFMSLEGTAEVNRRWKIFEINDAKILLVKEAQNNKIRSTSQLATFYLRSRGGEMYSDIIAEWVPPTVHKGNRIKMAETAEELTNTFNAYKGLIEGIQTKKDSVAKDFMPEILGELLKHVAKEDPIVRVLDDIIKAGIAKGSVRVASDAKEKSGGGSQNPQAEEEDEAF